MAYKIWNWLLSNWPLFSYDKNVLEKLELQFSLPEAKRKIFVGKMY